MSIPNTLPDFQLTWVTQNFTNQEMTSEDIETLEERLRKKANAILDEHQRDAVYNHVAKAARNLRAKLHRLKQMPGISPEHIQQVGLKAIKELEISSNKLIHNYTRFQNGISTFQT